MRRLIGARAAIVWLLLVLPLFAVRIWIACISASCTWLSCLGDMASLAACCGVLVLVARWRTLGWLSWPVAVLCYAAAWVLTLAEGMSFYFQDESFNSRFFANLQWGNLRSALHAFPLLFGVSFLLLAGVLLLAIALLKRQARLRARDDFLHGIFKGAVLVALGVFAIAMPSALHRLLDFFGQERQSAQLVFTERGREVARAIDPDPVPRDQLRAWPGKNLVIIYMESLERIYTDQRVFPGLTPNLNRYRASGLDYSGYLTYAGAGYTMAGIFASQCGVPLITSPWKALAFDGNENNDTTFQPNLACLGDVLHAAHYRQVFINGSPLSFADQGAFFRLHGFDREWGLDELEADSGHTLSKSQWGVYDSDLLGIALRQFRKLSAAGKPFNLDVLTIDNHPPHGRPSPGCPHYAANDNDVLQAVHCTDFLMGRFLDAISADPAWKNTVVAVMSDHLSMRNDAWPLYPPGYRRRPLLFILNAGSGERGMRFFHMDIAPTLLHLMGVVTNATFMAGADRSAANAPGSPLANDATDLAVIRQAVWARAAPIELCKDGVLLQGEGNGFQIGGRNLPLILGGETQTGLDSEQLDALFVTRSALKNTVIKSSDLEKVLSRRGDASVLLISPSVSAVAASRFSIDWIGRNGARAHLADVPRLLGLQLHSPQCSGLLAQADEAAAGGRLDFSSRFEARSAPLYPALARQVNFGDTAPIRGLQRDFGWLPSASWGAWTSGDAASLGFSLPPSQCHQAVARFSVYPLLSASRPRLDVRVLANGKPVATWHLGGIPAPQEETATLDTADPQCRVDLLFQFSRPGAAPPPYPPNEDPRPLQLTFKSMRLLPPATAPASAQSGR